MSRPRASEGMSILTMTLLVGIVITYLLWGIATAMYDADQGNRWLMPVPDQQAVRPRASPIAIMVVGVIAFVSNSVMYMPSVLQVVGFTVTKRTWYVFVVLVVEAAVVGFGIATSRLEKSLSSNTGFKTKRKARKMALPTPSDD